jgi:hypothetical protein
MLSESTIRSPYDVRVTLIQETLTANSPLDDASARDLAILVLHALNSIPEKMR